jgi:hypothetical protein
MAMAMRHRLLVCGPRQGHRDLGGAGGVDLLPPDDTAGADVAPRDRQVHFDCLRREPIPIERSALALAPELRQSSVPRACAAASRRTPVGTLGLITASTCHSPLLDDVIVNVTSPALYCELGPAETTTNGRAAPRLRAGSKDVAAIA